MADLSAKDVPSTSVAKLASTAVDMPVTVPVQPTVSIDDFCYTLKQSEKRSGLIYAFQKSETAAERYTDTAVNYQGRFQLFIHKPVKG